MNQLLSNLEFAPFPKMARLSRDVVITEKIDGTNAQVLILDKVEVLPEDLLQLSDCIQVGDLYLRFGSRQRWITVGDDNFGFAAWATQNAEELAKLGPGRHFGEWWGQGIQRGYGLKEKRFSLFNVHRWSDDAVRPSCCHVVPKLYEGMFDTSQVDFVLSAMKSIGSAAAPGFMKPEGVIVFHKAGNFGLKKTIEKDEEPKSKSAA